MKRGSLVVDKYGNRGIVVKIIPGTDNENHGIIYVWQIDKLNYGGDNCEHYVELGWQNNLTVLEE